MNQPLDKMTQLPSIVVSLYNTEAKEIYTPSDLKKLLRMNTQLDISIGVTTKEGMNKLLRQDTQIELQQKKNNNNSEEVPCNDEHENKSLLNLMRAETQTDIHTFFQKKINREGK